MCPSTIWNTSYNMSWPHTILECDSQCLNTNLVYHSSHLKLHSPNKDSCKHQLTFDVSLLYQEEQLRKEGPVIGKTVFSMWCLPIVYVQAKKMWRCEKLRRWGSKGRLYQGCLSQRKSTVSCDQLAHFFNFPKGCKNHATLWAVQLNGATNTIIWFLMLSFATEAELF